MSDLCDLSTILLIIKLQAEYWVNFALWAKTIKFGKDCFCHMVPKRISLMTAFEGNFSNCDLFKKFLFQLECIKITLNINLLLFRKP